MKRTTKKQPEAPVADDIAPVLHPNEQVLPSEPRNVVVIKDGKSVEVRK